ncbi:hypothetical protein R6Q59_009928 [Mikania micrantha]
MAASAIKLVVSPREYDVLRDFVQSNIDDSYTLRKRSERIEPTPSDNDANAASFRAATRVYLGTSLSLKAVNALLAKLKARRQPAGTAPVGLGVSRHRLALSLASLLFFHRVLHRLFARLRLQLLHEKVRDIRERYPAIYAALTSRYAPAVGAGLSGLALGVYPAGQLRITVTIYALVRMLEVVFKAVEEAGYLKGKPRWVSSWVVFALAQGQLLHAFVFDRDCFPEAYGSFILNNSQEYIPRKPDGMSQKVTWPKRDEMIDALAEMARLRWPPFVSPTLHPQRATTLPATANPVINPITSRAHPAIQHLSCALLHPSDVSCFVPYLRQILRSFPQIARFFALYYGAFSMLRIRKLFAAPGPFLNHLSKQILKTSIAICGAIATSWGSICLFNNVLPKKMFPQFRLFLGGLLGGTFAIVDQSASGHSNAMYAARTSLDSLWKVGKKRGWWKGVQGGDVWLFVVSLMAMNIVYDLHTQTDASMKLLKVLRGETEIGLPDQVEAHRAKAE